MKVKTVVIALLAVAGISGGIAYGVRYSMKSQIKPVDVVPMEYLNQGEWMGNTSSSEGMIVSMSSQNVTLDAEKELLKVYVKAGDQVKIGDPLLEYDMTLQELKREMSDLTRQTQELELADMEKELRKLQNTRASASLSLNDRTMTASDDGLLEDPGEEDTVHEGKPADDAVISDDGSGGVTPPGSQGGEDITPPGSQGGEEPAIPDGQTPGGDGSGELMPDGSGMEDPLPGDSEQVLGDEEPLEAPGDMLVGENSGLPDDGEVLADPAEILADVNSFLTRVNQLSAQELDQLISSDISEALRIYREKLSKPRQAEFRDVLAERRMWTVYSLTPEVASVVGESTEKVLEQAYNRACVYQLIYVMNQIDPDGRDPEELDEESLRLLEENIRQAVDAFYELQDNHLGNYLAAVVTDRTDDAGKEMDELLAGDFSSYLLVTDPDAPPALLTCTERLAAYVERLNRADVLEETESESEPFTEMGPPGDFGGGGESYTAEELRQMIAQQELEIKEQKLDIRESELEVKQYDRELEERVIRSNMNGVVVTAGTMDDAVIDDDFIVIAGASGKYLKGTINELMLDSVHVGDTVTGMSYDTGMEFTAEITEISPYPADNADYYYNYGENNNASQYQFLAYIEESDGLGEDWVEYRFSQSAVSSIYIERMLIREETDGREYVYLQGEDGLLKKQYVQTGSVNYSYIEIKEGLTLEDKLAFPYGRNVFEGAQTREVSSFYEDSYYY